jgi:hypothetical protein
MSTTEDDRHYLYRGFGDAPLALSGGPYSRDEADLVKQHQDQEEETYHKNTGRHFRYVLIEIDAGTDPPDTTA